MSKKNKKQIEEWLEEGVITQDQAERMLVDVEEKSKDESSNKLIVIISLVGSIFLGIGVILFVAANWDYMPDFLKTMVLLLSTFTIYYLGYLFKYDKKNLPRTGSSLFFLGALLFGASIFLLAQIYNVEANAHVLVLVWILGIVPLIYAFKSLPITVLSMILFFIWTMLIIFESFENLSYRDESVLLLIPIIYLLTGMLVFGIGGLHYFINGFNKIARLIRIMGILVAVSALFLLTFEIFSYGMDYGNYYCKQDKIGSEKCVDTLSDMMETVSPDVLSHLTIVFTLLSIIAIIITFVNLLFNPSKSKVNVFESLVVLVFITISMLFYFFLPTTVIYTVIFNLLFVWLVLFITFRGYQREDISLVNIGFFWLAIFILVKYFDFFFELMEKSLFFMLGGLILVLGGIAMEKQRRKLKVVFAKSKI